MGSRLVFYYHTWCFCLIIFVVDCPNCDIHTLSGYFCLLPDCRGVVCLKVLAWPGQSARYTSSVVHLVCIMVSSTARVRRALQFAPHFVRSGCHVPHADESSTTLLIIWDEPKHFSLPPPAFSCIPVHTAIRPSLETCHLPRACAVRVCVYGMRTVVSTCDKLSPWPTWCPFNSNTRADVWDVNGISAKYKIISHYSWCIHFRPDSSI